MIGPQQAPQGHWGIDFANLGAELPSERFLRGSAGMEAVRVAVNIRVLGEAVTGVQRYTLELVRHFGERVDLIGPREPLRGPRGHLWEQLVLPRLLKGKLLFSPSNTGPLLVDRQVVAVHDAVPMDHPEWLNPRFAAWYRFLIPRLVCRVRRVIVNSEFTRGRLLDTTRVRPGNVVVIPLGVDSDRFRPRPEDELRAARKTLGLPTREYVLFVGTLHAGKNVHRLLMAWQRIEAKLPENVWLVLAGSRGASRVFREMPHQRLPSRVYLAGHVDELLPHLYAGALAVAHVSAYEGFGLPVLEAMAAGAPVLAGNRTALPEVTGGAALLVDPYDVDAIADGLMLLLQNTALRSELRQKGLERAKQFSWERTAMLTWKVLEEAAAE